MDVLAQWPAALSVGTASAPEKTAEDDVSLESLVRRAALMGVEWEAEEVKIAAPELKDAARTSAPVTKTNVWRHNDAHPLVLLILVLDRYGQDALEWEPETLRLTLARDELQLSQSTWTKILAARVLLMSPSPWRQWNAFHVTCRGLAGFPPNFVYLEEPEIGHLMLGADCMRIADPARHTSDEVDKYVAAVFKHEGLAYAPAPLDFAQRELEDPKISCTNCGAIHRDDNDVKCITCGSQLLVKVPYVFAALRDATKALFAKKEKLPLERALAGLTETPEGYAAKQLLIHWNYAKAARKALTEQLRMLR